MHLDTGCPRCGYQSAGISLVNQDSARSLVSTPQDEIRFIEDETRRLDDLISQLRKERAGLLRRLNDIHALTSEFPYEIISSIFRDVCPPIDLKTRDFRTEYAHRHPYERRSSDFEDPGPLIPIMLGAVSSRWRQIAWSTQDLWTSIALEVKEAQVQSQARLLDLYFGNAGGLSVSLELDFREYFLAHHRNKNSEGDENPLAPIHAVILKYSPKIQILRLSAVPPEWVDSLSGVFTSLEDLSLGWPTNGQIKPTQHFSFIDILALRRVTIRRLWAPLKLPWTQMVVLDLDRMTIDTCVELLIECRNLEEYSVREPSFTPSDRRHPSLDGTITLDNLRILIWTCLPDAWSIAMLEHVRFSRLGKLEWHGFPGDQNRSRFRDFFSDLPSTLRTLGLTRYDSPEGLLDILANIPQLTHLELLSCQSRFCRSIFHNLTLTALPESHDMTLLPALEALTFNRCDDMQEFGFKNSFLFKDLLSMLRVRSAAALMDQGLSLQFIPNIKWRAEAHRALRKIVDEGIKVKILEDSELGNW